ncbi:MAG: DUF1016 N-terminal domain-containing protein [Bacteroidales bacterium]|nr:DUF1016 N-terminal domain-containing protein [Bacteroidales bacterium]
MNKPLDKKNEVQVYINELFVIISPIINNARKRAALYLSAETTLLYWTIGKHINTNLKENNRTVYGQRIIATLSQQLTENFGKGFTYTTLTRMCKVADAYHEENIATLSQQISWSNLIELASVEEEATFFKKVIRVC